MGDIDCQDLKRQDKVRAGTAREGGLGQVEEERTGTYSQRVLAIIIPHPSAHTNTYEEKNHAVK